MKHKHIYTTTELFNLVVKQLRNEGRFPDLILDYALATDTVLEFRNCHKVPRIEIRGLWT